MNTDTIEPQLDTQKLQALANQLRCPSKDEGIRIGGVLHNTNGGMITQSINALRLENKNRVLELGPGSCHHLPEVLDKATNLGYFGMEISKTMVQEADRINESYINKRQAVFQTYNGTEIPYVHFFFDRILTVNTIYFWENPWELLKEMYRVLKPSGIAVITFADSEFMKNLPFVNKTDVFNLFNDAKIKDLILKTPFKIQEIKNRTELVKSKSGDMVHRAYSVVVLSK